MDNDAFWKKLCSIVETHGWVVQPVLEDYENRIPKFSYTIGLSAHGLPEILILGVDPRTAQVFLDAAAEKLIAGTYSAKTGSLVHEVANMPLRVKELEPSQFGYFGIGATRHGEQFGHPVPSFLLQYPDERGLFPDAPGCDPQIREIQDIDVLIERSRELEPSKPIRGPRRH